MSLTIHIERLVLDGVALSAHQTRLLHRGIEEALRTTLAERPHDRPLTAPRTVTGTEPRQLGGAIAHAIVGHLKGGA